jgi:hypothetical protein
LEYAWFLDDEEHDVDDNSITCSSQMEEAMTTLKFRSLTFVVSLAVLVVASASAGAQPTYKHKAHVDHFTTSWTATALVPAAAAAVRAHETDGLSRDRDDCNFGCIDN